MESSRFVHVALWSFGIIACLYAAICAFLYLRQRDMMYFPQFTRVAAERTDFALRSGGVTLRGWRLHADARDPIVYFGGNAEAVQHNVPMFDACCRSRPVYLLAYRGYGASDGLPSSEALLADALALYDDVAKRHPGQRVSVIGRSLGSGVAAHVAVNREVDRLVLITPYDRMSTVGALHYPWLPVRWLMRERFDSADWLRDSRVPMLVLRASHDSVVPKASTDALVAALHTKPQEITIPDSNHDSLSESPRYVEALSAFLR